MTYLKEFYLDVVCGGRFVFLRVCCAAPPASRTLRTRKEVCGVSVCGKIVSGWVGCVFAGGARAVVVSSLQQPVRRQRGSSSRMRFLKFKKFQKKLLLSSFSASLETSRLWRTRRIVKVWGGSFDLARVSCALPLRRPAFLNQVLAVVSAVSPR